MKKDRVYIKKLLGGPIDSITTDLFEHMVESARAEAIGWAYADVCCALDAGKDPRETNIGDMLARAESDLDTEDQ